MKHFTSPRFWRCYRRLPKAVQKLADKNFELLKSNPHHPSLQLKKIETYRSVRVGLSYRALAIEESDGLVWFWIGTHSDYDALIR